MYILLILASFIYNEFLVINVCGLANNTKLFLYYKEQKDLSLINDNNSNDNTTTDDNINDNNINDNLTDVINGEIIQRTSFNNEPINDIPLAKL